MKKNIEIKLKMVGLIWLGLVVATAIASSGEISGVVVDEEQKPVVNAHVFLNPGNRATTSDLEGRFSFENVAPGRYRCKIDHIGYQVKYLRDLEIQAGAVFNLGSIVLRSRVIGLEGVIITATRNERRLFEVAQPINVVSAAQIRQRNAKTSAEALREESGIFVQKTSHGGGSAIIRGLSSNQVLLLVDGIRLNNSLYRLGNHPYLTTVDNYSLQQIEIVRGPTSVLYGSDALGGTINLITKMPTMQSTDYVFKYRVSGRYASADAEQTLRTEASLNQAQLAWQGGFSWKSFGDLKRGGNSHYPQLEKSTNGIVQTPTAFRAYDFDTKLAYEITPSQLLIGAFQSTRRMEIPRYDKYEGNNFYRWIYHPQNRDLAYLRYENNLQKKYLNSYALTLSLQRQIEGRETQPTSTEPLTREKDTAITPGLNVYLHSKLKSHLLTYGCEFYFDKIASERFTVFPGTGRTEKEMQARYPDGAVYQSFGAFIQDEIFLTARWEVLAGLRFSAFHTEFTLPDDPQTILNLGKIHQNFQALTGSVSAIYKVTDRFHINTNIGQAFRAPNLSDLSKFGESKGMTFEVPNPELEPEKMMSYDIGLKGDFSRWQMMFSTYYAQITDLLASAEATFNGRKTIGVAPNEYQVKAKQNIGSAYIYGFESAFNWHVYQNLGIHTNFTYTYGQNTTQNEPVGGIPPLFGVFAVQWRDARTYFDGYLRFAGAQRRLSADDLDDPRIPPGGTPRWYTFNGRVGFQLFRSLNVQLAIENILDFNYREHGSGVNGPGRNFIVGCELRN